MNFQPSLLIGSIATLIFVIFVAKKTSMNIKYAIIWVVWCLIISILSLFPKIIDVVSSILNIATPTNAVFMIFIFLSYLMSFYLFIKVSQLSDYIKTLTYELAEVKRKYEDKESK